MTKNEFLREIETVVEAAPGSLTGEESLAKLPGWDSMAAIGFIAMVDSRLGVVVNPADLAACKTVADLVALAGDRVQD